MTSRLLSAAIVVLCVLPIANAQSINVTRRTVTYRRPKPQVAFKKTFTITYPRIKAATPTVSRRIEQALSYFKAFDFTLKEEVTDLQWLESADFTTDVNQNGVLSVTLSIEGSAAYPDGSSRHIVVDTKTGARAHSEDVFTDLNRLASVINGRMQKEIKSQIEEIKQDPKTRDVDADELFAEKTFALESLEDFSVGKNGVTFYYDYGFPHVIEALQPSGEFAFTWAELKPFIKRGGLLARFVR